MKDVKAWHYQELIKWKENPKEVCEAVLMAIWLIVDHNRPLSHAVTNSCKKHGAKKTPVTKMIRSILPANYLRKKAAARMKPEVKAVIKAKKIAEYEAKKFQKNEEQQIEVAKVAVIEEKPKRLTIDVPPALHREFKAFCAMQGKTMSVVFVDAITKAIKG